MTSPELAPPVETGMPVTIIGLGKMGGRMATKLLGEGHEVHGWDLEPDVRDAMQEKGIHTPDTLEEAILSQDQPGGRVVWQMLQAGKITETSLRTVAGIVDQGDVVIDGGNSRDYETDTRAEWMGQLGIRFLGIGVSGGIIAETAGYPIMVGGDESAYEDVTPILDSLARPMGGHDYLGPGGNGHTLKMVHNGIEYPYMQAIGEGAGVLAARGIDVERAFRLYQRGTLISGFMVDRMVEALAADPGLESVDGEIGSASGEAVWTVEEAERLGVPAESIAQAIDFRRRSAIDPAVRNSFAAKSVAALRATFGGHPIKRKS